MTDLDRWLEGRQRVYGVPLCGDELERLRRLITGVEDMGAVLMRLLDLLLALDVIDSNQGYRILFGQGPGEGPMP